MRLEDWSLPPRKLSEKQMKALFASLARKARRNAGNEFEDTDSGSGRETTPSALLTPEEQRYNDALGNVFQNLQDINPLE